MTNVVDISDKRKQLSVAASLRKLADSIEAGEIMTPATAVVVMAETVGSMPLVVPYGQGTRATDAGMLSIGCSMLVTEAYLYEGE